MTDDNVVGYKRPPKQHRFKPGHSGNPKGRPKGTKNLAVELQQIMKEKITVREGNMSRRMTKLEAMLRYQYERAMKGDTKAFATIFKLTQSLNVLGHDQEQSMRGGVLCVPAAALNEAQWSLEHGGPKRQK